MEQKSTQASLDKIISLCKRKGFVFQTAEIYGGLQGVYDFGHLGFLLRENIKKAWRDSIENDLGEIYTLEGSLLGVDKMWEASGHIANFHDPMITPLPVQHFLKPLVNQIDYFLCIGLLAF